MKFKVTNLPKQVESSKSYIFGYDKKYLYKRMKLRSLLKPEQYLLLFPLGCFALLVGNVYLFHNNLLTLLIVSLSFSILGPTAILIKRRYQRPFWPMFYYCIAALGLVILASMAMLIEYR